MLSLLQYLVCFYTLDRSVYVHATFTSLESLYVIFTIIFYPTDEQQQHRGNNSLHVRDCRTYLRAPTASLIKFDQSTVAKQKPVMQTVKFYLLHSCIVIPRLM